MTPSPDHPAPLDAARRMAEEALADDAKATAGPWEDYHAKKRDRVDYQNGGLFAPDRRPGDRAVWDGADGRSPDEDTLAWICNARTREPRLARALLAAVSLAEAVQAQHPELVRSSVADALFAFRAACAQVKEES